MEKKLTRDVQRLLDSQHQDKRRGTILRCLAAFVVLATISALAMPALTLSNEVICGIEEHVHTESCYSEEWVAPQPALVCGAEQSGKTLIHTHNSYCCDAEGNVVCTIPELEFHVHGADCYQERRELICEEPQELGHTHGASCYAYDKGELVCGLEEGGGHVHTEECYPMERMVEPQCGQVESDDVVDGEGNVIQTGHRHTEECYMQRVFQKLRYEHEETQAVVDEEGNVVSEGHTHNAACWMTKDELVTCGQQEGQGHTHSKDCTEWVQRLICQEEERPAGHIHDDSCYNITPVLTCQKNEVVVHVHTEACSDENGTLTCGKPEIGEHQHTSACLAEQEGEPELTRVIVCGIEEHTHGDPCYLETETEKGPVYYCGVADHLHNADCYFDSGALCCTMEEHFHDLSCLEPRPEETGEPDPSEDPEASMDPESSEDPEESGAPEDEEITGITLEEYSYTYESDTFTVTYHITGYARLTDEEAPAAGGPADSAIAPASVNPDAPDSGDPWEVTIDSIDIPLSAIPRGLSMFAPSAEVADSDPYNAPPMPEEENSAEPGSVPDPEGSAVTDSTPIPTPTPEPAPVPTPEAIQTPVPEATQEPMPETVQTPVPEATQAAAPELPDSPAADQIDLGAVEAHVTEIFSGEEYDAVVEQMEKAVDEDTVVVPLQVLEFTVSVGGRLLDLSECKVTATVQPTEELKEMLSGASVNATSYNETEPDAETEDDAFSVYAFTRESMGSKTFSLDSEDSGMKESSSDSLTVQLFTTGTRAAMGRAITYKVNPSFYVQFYANLNIPDRVAKGKEKTDSSLPLIDTTGRNLPKNGVSEAKMPLTYLNLDQSASGYTVHFKDEPTEVYQKEKREFNPKLKDELNISYLDSLESNDHYKVLELWVLKDGRDLNSTKRDDWYIYGASDWKNLVFTNNLSFKTDQRSEDGEIYIVIQQEVNDEPTTVMRLVYDVETKGESFASSFYDYDISTGVIFRTNTPNSPDGSGWNHKYADDVFSATGTTVKSSFLTWAEGNTAWDGHIYTYTKESGINSSGNYSGSGTKLAFGNVNTGTMLGKLTWSNNGKDNELNKYNNASYKGCTFGLAANLKSDGTIQYASGIRAPKLFNEGGATGKTAYPGNKGGDYSLQFDRVGDTYTLIAVNGTGAANLGTFSHPTNSTGPHNDIWTNNFWPMDSTGSFGTRGHDVKFGGTATFKGKEHEMRYGPETQRWDNTAGDWDHTFPESDDGKYHNSYFGMNFSVDFSVTKEYVGPLEYYFYGDDDMWVFLDGKLVCDIGGVHSSVGEYVDLWEYIDTTRPGEAVRKDHGSSSHTLSVFYTERGASGSTCWMQFTLPMLSSTTNAPYDPDKAGLTIEKKVEGATENVADAEFPFILKLSDIVNLYDFKFYDAKDNDLTSSKQVKDNDGSVVGQVSAGYYYFSLKDGERFEVIGLPDGTGYQVTEGTGYQVGDKEFPTSDGINTTVVSDDENGTTGKLVASGTIRGEHVLGSDGQMKDKITPIKVTYTNTFTYSLPETGGAGTYTMAGLPLTTALFCLMYKKKSHGKGAAP